MKVEPIKRKFCKLCEKGFPWTPTYFHYWDRSSGRLHIYCKPCKIAYVMSWKHAKKTAVLKKQAFNRKRRAKPKTLIVKKQIEIEKVSTKALKVKKNLPEEPTKRPVLVKYLREDCRKAIALFLSDRISTSDLFKAIKPFYGSRTGSVVKSLRLRKGL